MLKFIHTIFLVYTALLAVRIIATWFPASRGQAWLFWVARFTDPYLNIFRRFIPPIGGVLDLSPMLAFLGIKLVEFLLMKVC